MFPVAYITYMTSNGIHILYHRLFYITFLEPACADRFYLLVDKLCFFVWPETFSTIPIIPRDKNSAVPP